MLCAMDRRWWPSAFRLITSLVTALVCGSCVIVHADADTLAAMAAGHIDAVTAKLKPVSKKPVAAGYVQLGVAPYAGALSSTWWDRDLGVGGRVIVKTGHGKIESKLVKLGWPIARISTLAPHFGAAAVGPFNQETQMIPVIGLESNADDQKSMPEGSFAAKQPARLVKAISSELGITDCKTHFSDGWLALTLLQTLRSSAGSWSSTSLPLVSWEV